MEGRFRLGPDIPVLFQGPEGSAHGFLPQIVDSHLQAIAFGPRPARLPGACGKQRGKGRFGRRPEAPGLGIPRKAVEPSKRQSLLDPRASPGRRRAAQGRPRLGTGKAVVLEGPHAGEQCVRLLAT